MFRRLLLAMVLAGLMVSAGWAGDQPNFIIMMTDDQRWDTLSCEGNPVIKTPNMDRIAGDGIRFRNMFVTNSLCAPGSSLAGRPARSHAAAPSSENFSTTYCS